MLKINNQLYERFEIERVYRQFEELDHFREIEGKRIALCVKDPLDTITLVRFFREKGCSTLLIHGETPLQTAYTMAMKGECHGLVYGDPQNFRPIIGEKNRMETTPSIYQYSSGTTGEPKLIARAWKEIDLELASYNQTLQTTHEIEPIILVPVSHSYGLIAGVLSALRRGVTPHIVTKRNPKYMLQVIQASKRHLVYGVPSLLQVLASFDQGHLRFDQLMSSGAPLTESLFNKLKGMADTVKQQYGCSEAGCISIANQMNQYSDLGVPLGHFQVETSQDAANPAEIVVSSKGKQIWTRDLGYMDGNGHLHFVARVDDVINVSGLKVFPLEVEEVIGLLPEVQEVVVYRGKHPMEGAGEIVKAMVVAQGNLTAEKIRDWCMGHLPPYKVPVEVECVSAIPKTQTGKVSRKLLEIGDI